MKNDVMSPNAAKLIIVDDDEIVCTLLSKYLVSAGYEVETFTDPKAALRRIKESTANLIISDLMMPEMDGMTFMVKARDIREELPFIFVSASQDLNRIIELMQLGSDDYLLKPLNQPEVVFRVERVLQINSYRKAVAAAKHEQEVLELENKRLVNWRHLYASKETRQTEMLVEILSRSINQAGGFMWVDFLSQSLQPGPEGTKVLPAEVADMVVEAATRIRDTFDSMTFIGNLSHMPLSIQHISYSSFFDWLRLFIGNAVTSLVEPSQRQVRLHADPRATTMSLELDLDVFGRIINELLVNAIKYSPEKSAIQVEVQVQSHANGANLVLAMQNEIIAWKRVDEQGVPIHGIPNEFSEMIFELFYTMDAFPRYHDGEEWTNGSGLYICRKLLRRMNGWIQARNINDYTNQERRVLVSMEILLPLVG